MEHQRRALLGLRRLHRGSRLRGGWSLVRRVRHWPVHRRLLLLLLPVQRRRRLVFAPVPVRLARAPPRRHGRGSCRVRRAVRRAGPVPRQHGGDGGLRGAAVGRHGGHPAGLHGLPGDRQGRRRGAHHAARRRQGEDRRRRAQGGRGLRRARRPHGQQRRQNPRRPGDSKEGSDRCFGGDANPCFSWPRVLAVWIGVDCLRAGVPGVDPGCRDVCTVRYFSPPAQVSVFAVASNVVGDTCVAMGEWVQHPQARTALDDILPCVDTAAANEALDRGKEVNYQLVAVLNAALTNVSNRDFPPQVPPPLNYNQSGPPVPLLCNPYTADLRDRACAPGEVPFDGAAARQAWLRYVCRASSSNAEVCATPGRVTPSMYEQLAGAADVSYGLYHYGPALVALADCTFVRETFRSIGDDHCPGLSRYSGQVFRGLLAAAVAVLLAVLLWVVHSRERRRRSEAKEILLLASSPYKFPVEERAFLKSPARPYM